MPDLPEWISKAIDEPWCSSCYYADEQWIMVTQFCGTSFNVWIVPGTAMRATLTELVDE